MAENKKIEMPRIGIAILNLTGLGLGYLVLKNWKRWMIHFASLIALILLATLAYASKQPVLWILAFAIFFIWMAFDGWKLAGKDNVKLPGQVVKSPWILFAVTALILVGEVLGFLWFQSSARAAYKSAEIDMLVENYPAAALKFDKVVRIYQLSFDPVVTQAQEKYIEVNNLVIADEAFQQGQFESAIDQYGQYLKAYPRSSQVKAVQDQIASAYREWGLSLQKQAKYEEALEKYATSFKLYPNAPVISHFYEERASLNLQLARQQVESTDYSAGIETYKVIFTSFPRSAVFSQASAEVPAVYFRFAQAEESKGKYDSAIDALNKLLTDYPSASVADRAREFLPEVKISKAGLLLNQSHFVDALSILNELKDSSQDDAFLAQVSAERDSAINMFTLDNGYDAIGIIDLAKNIACGKVKAESSDLSPMIPQVVGILKNEPARAIACSTSIPLPADKTANIPGTFRYVIKRVDGTERVQTCNYTGGHRLERIRRTVNLSLVDVLSGKVVTKIKLVGTSPAACPSRRSFRSLTEKTYGGNVTNAQMEAWIKKVVK